jgi:hypothetical protein
LVDERLIIGGNAELGKGVDGIEIIESVLPLSKKQSIVEKRVLHERKIPRKTNIHF